jgi:hypothetical protein
MVFCEIDRVDAKYFALVIDFISRLTLAKLVYLMYLWIGETTVKSAADTTGVSQKTIVQLYQYILSHVVDQVWVVSVGRHAIRPSKQWS